VGDAAGNQTCRHAFITRREGHSNHSTSYRVTPGSPRYGAMLMFWVTVVSLFQPSVTVKVMVYGPPVE